MSKIKLLYRPDEVAELLSTSKSQIYTLIKEGELEAHCRNGAGQKPIMVIAESVTGYVDRHKVDPEKWRE